jgi:hypothetical protein
MAHLLDPLLRPKSVAVVGASARKDSMGAWALTNLERGGFKGAIYPVNPGYDELRGLCCYKRLADLPETPELVIFAVGDQRIEAAFDAAYARRRLNELKLEALLKGVRGRPAANIDAFCDMAARFSAMVDALRDDLQEVDVNLAIVGPDKSIAVDALVIGRANKKGERI